MGTGTGRSAHGSARLAVAGRSRSLPNAPSVIGRLAHAASLCQRTECPGREETCASHQREFHAWVASEPSWQLDDLRVFLPTGKADLERRLSLEVFRAIAPRSTPGSIVRLFLCCVEAALAVLRYERAGHGISGAWSVGRALEAASSHARGPCVTLKELARSLGVSVAHFGRLFHKHTGLSFHQYQRLL